MIVIESETMRLLINERETTCPGHKINQSKQRNMKIYIQDYSKPSEANNLLYSALRFMEKGIYLPAKKHITQASLLLRQFLAGDNLIIDPDAVGLIKGEDFFDKEQLCFIRDEFACIMEQTGNKNDELDIINKCCRMLDDPEYESYEEFTKCTSSSWCEKNTEEV